MWVIENELDWTEIKKYDFENGKKNELIKIVWHMEHVFLE